MLRELELKRVERVIRQQEMQWNHLEEQVEEARRTKQDSEKKKKKKKKKKERDDCEDRGEPMQLEEQLKKDLERHKKIASKLQDHRDRFWSGTSCRGGSEGPSTRPFAPK